MYTWNGQSVALMLDTIGKTPAFNKGLGAIEQRKKDMVIVGVGAAVMIVAFLLLRKGK